jgi:hypothetical protein
MEKLTPINKKITDFIYEKPDVAVVLLQQFGYDIDLKTATLQQINKLVYGALYVNQDEGFAKALDNAIANDGENNFVVAIATSVIGSVLSGVFASKQGDKTRELQKQLKLSELALTEKISLEQIRAEQETARLGIMANSLLEYRKTLVKESTVRLKDTWLYVTGLGVGLGVLYGVYLIGSDI